MTEREWKEIAEALRDVESGDRAVAAAEKLQRVATSDDVSRLLALLKDDSFFVREAAAWPLSDLGVTNALPDLLEARYRGFQDGHDNDGLSAALADLVATKPREAAATLRVITSTGEKHLRAHAVRLLEFCDEGGDA